MVKSQKKKSLKLELKSVFSAEAITIQLAREKCRLLHNAKDIDAAGDEVEICVRDFYSRKLPNSYHVGHGHIVDQGLSQSGQYDIVVADNNQVPILFKAENGAEFFPYESVYAIGEIKSTYDSAKEPIEKFIRKNKNLKERLVREATPNNYIGDGITLGSDFKFQKDKRPYKNPLFSFMFFVDKGDLNLEKIKEIYMQQEPGDLPNLICFLNYGCIVNGNIIVENKKNKVKGVNVNPELLEKKEGTYPEWVFLPLGAEENDTLASNLAYCLHLLEEHLTFCWLMPPNLGKYMKELFKHRPGEILTHFQLDQNKDTV